MGTKWILRSASLILVLLLIITTGLISFKAEGRNKRDDQSSSSQNPKDPDPKQTPAPRKAEPSQQPTTRNQEEVIRINSNLVAVPVSVTDGAGQPVGNLQLKDFRLEEEGKTQEVVSLGDPGKTPVELALLFDISSSVTKRFAFEQQAAARFLKQVLKPIDAASVFSIGAMPRLVAPRETNVDQIIPQVMSIAPTKEVTAFFETIVEAAQYLGKTSAPGTRRVMIAISDGEDTASRRSQLIDAQRELQQVDCLFYAINPSGPSIRLNQISSRGHEGMTTLAAATGGATFLPNKLEDLDAVFRQVTVELQAQYLLGYYSTEERTEGNYRRISVNVPRRPDLRVRARSGYYAPKG